MIDVDREVFESGGLLSSVARPEIADSWKRSRLNGVDPDHVSAVAGDASLDSRFTRVAIPVLTAMADVMVGSRTSLLLSAPDGTMLWRWAEDNTLANLLDRNCAVVGTRWSEDVVGTNGIGTSLETTRPVFIRGEEHFAEALHAFTCAGAPIRHPITRRVAGILSVTSLTEHANPLMVPTLTKLTREIAEQLYGDSTLRERELLQHFLDERRRGRSAVVAVNHDTVIADTGGAMLQLDHRDLWNQVETGDGGPVTLQLAAPEHGMEISWRAIEQAGTVVGLVITGQESESVPGGEPVGAVPAGVAAPSAFDDLPGLLESALGDGDRLLVTGEPGVGKRTLVRRVAARSGLTLRELDGASVSERGVEEWLASARRALGAAVDGGPMVALLHLECLGADVCRALGRIFDDLPRLEQGATVVATWTPGGEVSPPLRSLLDRFPAATFDVPPLRTRSRDVLSRLVGQPAPFPVLTSGAVELVQRHPWPGNHRQLEEFRRWLARRSASSVGVNDLPHRFAREAARARLTAIQSAEANAIELALRAVDGNKAAAALALGISRSSLYRKLREYRIG